MNNRNKIATALAIAALLCAGTCFARPGGPGGPRGHRPGPAPAMHHRGHRPPPPPPRHHHKSGWGKGGRNFWPGFVGGLIGGAVASTIVEPAPVVVTTPTVVATPTVVTTPAVMTAPAVVAQPVVCAPVTQTQSVWVEGRYIDQVQANGAVIRVWQPGHYEQRTICLQ